MSTKIEKTITKEYTEGGTSYRATARYGFEYIKGNSAPHFHVVVDVYRKGRFCVWEEDSFGCQHDLVRDRFPEIAHLVRWHLFDTTAPMHYLANSVHWWEMFTKESKWAQPEHTRSYDPNPLEAFKSTIAFGALPDDGLFDLTPTHGRTQEVTEWLSARLPKLMETFRAEVEASGFVWDHVLALPL